MSKYDALIMAEKIEKEETLKKLDVTSILSKVKADIRKLQY